MPLSRWDPKAVKDKVLTRVDEKGEQSKWVSTMMRSFCKMVSVHGFISFIGTRMSSGCK